MAELTKADHIWNRACVGEAASLLSGDRALAAMLAFHNVTMNGGALHALECLELQRLEAAASGYRYFGLDGVADLLNEAKSALKIGDDGLDFWHTEDDLLDFWEAELDRRYGALVPDDSALAERFELALRRNPSQFAPL
jgi:hypothetical protein